MGADKKIIEGILFLIAGFLVTGAAGLSMNLILLIMGIILITGGVLIIIHYLNKM